MYTDLKSSLDSLRSETKKLWSTQTDYALADASRKVTVSSNDSGSTVMTATADSDAAVGSYSISDIHLATTHRISSSQQFSNSSEMGVAGTVTLNGVDITIGSSDTLYTLASKINSTTFADGKGVVATIIDRRLILEASESGSEAKMTMSGSALQSLGLINESGGFVNQLADGENATFKLNGMQVERSKNSDLDDVIEGVAINLASDAEGGSATFKVESDVSALTTAVNSFISKYNSLQTYLGQKLTTKKVDDTTYERGALLSDSTVRYMRSEISDAFSSSISSGDFQSFGEIGLALDDDLKITVEDSSKYTAALADNLDGVKSFLDNKMSKLDSLLEQYVGTSGSITYTLSDFTDQTTDIANRITKENDRLAAKKEALTQEYVALQTQLTQIQYDQQYFDAFYGTTSSSSSS